MNDRPTNEEREALLAGDRADALTPDEAAELPLLADLLADPSTWAEPDAGLEDRIVGAVRAAEPDAPSSVTPIAAGGARRAVAPRRRRLVMASLAAAAAIIIVVVTVIATRPGSGPDYQTQFAATALAPDAHASADIASTDAGFRVTLDARGLPDLQAGEYYQAWLKNAADTLVPIGSFSSDDDTVTLWSGVSPKDFPTMTVTIESTDNDQTSSGRRVLVGEIPRELIHEPMSRRATYCWLNGADDRSARTRRGPPMRSIRSLRALPLGLAAAASLAVGVTTIGPALVTPAGAAPNAASAFVTNGTLTINGSNAGDVVLLDGDATEARVTFGADPGNVLHFPLADFTSVAVSLGNGDDQFTEPTGVLTTKPTTVDGANGNDRITTGDAVDVVTGGNGNDNVDAGRGNDRVVLGNGDDFFVWNPGQGSDAADGGNGNDVMQFNGADQGEIMSLAANGSDAVFLRNLGTIRMDLHAIEVFNLRALGGVDDVTVDDLSGTSIRDVNLDLSAAVGGGDKAGDVVTVKGTNQADRVDVTAAGGQIELGGLQGDTHITGAETADHLQVNTLDGNDTVDVDPAVAAVIGVAVDLGAGQL